ncbi:MAG: DUF1501 domain-containing protein [Planctomycetales bacterium]|nr:DUF1501 domain-containing protein [Planctomycetales bacterium]
MTKPTATSRFCATRRDFLQSLTAGASVVSLGSSLPLFWQQAASGQLAEHSDSILVVLQLTGGNDGLNTVIPFRDEEYARLRPTLAITADAVHKLNDDCGFHPAMTGLSELFASGAVSVIHGVGYANPNRSHFESMDIWHTAQRKSQRIGTGWLGRVFDQQAVVAGGDSLGMHLGGEKQPLALAGARVRVPSIKSLKGFRLDTSGQPLTADAIASLNQLERKQRGSLLDFVQTTTATALQTSRQIEAIVQDAEESSYPASELGQKMRAIAQLIDAGLATRVYYVTLDGFDTHAQQAAAHEALLRQWSEAVTSFQRDLVARGHGDRVVTMVFSEFGRRVKENASRGTDHGTAAPVFLIGSRVRGGFCGDQPPLQDLDTGDLKFHTDFRCVYACVLEKWLGWNSRELLDGDYNPVDAIV